MSPRPPGESTGLLPGLAALALATAYVIALLAVEKQAVVLAVLAGVVAGGAVAWFTEPGQRFFVFGQESVAEAKKVAWPTRKETIQMTTAVFVFVLVMAVVLWVTDKTLEWVLYDLVLGWK